VKILHGPATVMVSFLHYATVLLHKCWMGRCKERWT